MSDREKVLAIIARMGGKETAALRPEMELVADLGIDSPKALQLLLEIEDVLGIEISDEDAARMDTVGDVLHFLGSPAAQPG